MSPRQYHVYIRIFKTKNLISLKLHYMHFMNELWISKYVRSSLWFKPYNLTIRVTRYYLSHTKCLLNSLNESVNFGSIRHLDFTIIIDWSTLDDAHIRKIGNIWIWFIRRKECVPVRTLQDWHSHWIQFL